jgi:hypothetical protein
VFPSVKATERKEWEQENKEKGFASREYRFECPAEGDTGTAFLTMPSSCAGESLVSSVAVQAWDGATAEKQSASEEVTGCDELQFEPRLAVEPEDSATRSPTGLKVDLSMPQDESLGGLSDADLKSAVVTLPEGMTINPASAGGRKGCPLLEGRESAKEEREGRKELVGINLESSEPANCPNASKIGTVSVKTPLLEHPLPGSIYLAAQEDNPFHSLLAIYLVIDDRVSGVVVKLAGHVELGEGGDGLSPGQIRTSFLENPELPVENVELELYGGPKAPLATPAACGSYTVTSQLMPWSSERKEPFTAEAPQFVEPAGRFAIEQGCEPAGFTPSFAAGTSSPQAGGFSPFSVMISRQDPEEDIGTVSVTAPPGLLGSVKSVAQCPEPQASKGECGPESLVGETSAAIGVGSDPYWITGGKVYLTGPYNNGPYGLSIVVPTTAGPFTLTGNGGYGREIVRASIRVNPYTSQITAVSDPLPPVIQGIPPDIRTIDVTINRPGFAFNPTNCSPLEATGTITSAQGASANVSTPFEAANCANLPYEPSIAVSTQAKTSKDDGASLTIKITAPTGQANTAKAMLTFPKQLPTRLTTLQKACLAAVFDANPASCPEGSIIGTAKVRTPVLAGTLTGPIYLVSHGGVEFPDAEIVLQGENNLTFILDGNTHIKHGITTSTFNSVPDAPFTSFETTLPEGPHSAFAFVSAKANYSMCGQKLTLPVTFTGQNGAVLTRTPKIAVAGCPKAKKTKKHGKKARRSKRR